MDGHIFAFTPHLKNAPLVPVFGIYINLYLLIAAGVALWWLLCYILRSRALQRLSANRHLRGGVWAWFPVGIWWVLGNLADDYAQKARGKRQHKRTSMLWLSISRLVLGCAFAVCAFGIFFFAAPLVLSVAAQILVPVLGVLWLVRLIIGIFALRNIYTSCDPDRAVADLIVSIVLPVTIPFILFACRDRDFGMPPAKMHMEIPATWKPQT